MNKNSLLIFLASFLLSFAAYSQQSKTNAIGVRLGDNDGFGAEVSYQRQISNLNRYELDLGFRNRTSDNAFKLTGLYQWVWNIDTGFNWYAGFGGGLGSWSNSLSNGVSDGFFLNADGVIGIEYIFEAPIMISLDFRPEIRLIGNYGHGTNSDIGLSVRYQFN